MSTMEAVAAEATGVEVEEAQDDRVRATLDRQARAWLGISGEAFLAGLHAGEYDETDNAATARLVSTARLLG